MKTLLSFPKDLTGFLLVAGLFGWGIWWLTNQRDEISTFSDPQKSIIVQQLYQLPDPSSRFSLSQIRRLPLQQWEQVSAINFGFEGGTGWAYSEVYSLEDQTVILELQSHFIDTVKVWLVSEKGSVSAYPLTGFRNLSHSAHNPLFHRYFKFELPLEANVHYSLFIQGSTAPGFTMKYAVKLWEPIAFMNYIRGSDWEWAVFVGIVLLVIFITLCCYIFHRKLIYLYYAGYVASLSLYGLVNDGWGIFLPFHLHQLLNPILIGHLLNLGVCFLLLFSRKFLVISSQPPQWWLRISPWWFWMLITVCIEMTHYGYSIHREAWTRLGYGLGLSVVAAAGLVWLSYLADAIKRGFQPAWLLFASQVILIDFYGMNVFLVNMNAVKLAFPDMLIYRVVLTAELLIIAIGWIYRQKVIRESQEQLQAVNVAQQQAVWEAERQWQEEVIKTLRLENELHGQRDRLARELHDGIGSQLTHIISRLDLLTFSTPQQNQLLRLSDFTRETNRNLRETIWILNQETISFNDFATRLHSFLRKLWEDRETPALNWQAPITSDNPVLPPLVALHLLRITQEATVNALKHAGASEVSVRMELGPADVTLLIEDNGRGFCQAVVSPGFGLSNMRWRAEETGGSFRMDTGDSGTSIRVTIPLTV